MFLKKPRVSRTNLPVKVSVLVSILQPRHNLANVQRDKLRLNRPSLIRKPKNWKNSRPH